MAGAFHSIVVDLVARTQGFESDLDRAKRIADKRLRQMERSFKNAGRNMVGALGVGLGVRQFAREMSDAVTKAKEFTTAMGEVSTLLSDTSDMEAYTKSARDMAKAFGTSAVLQANARYQVLSGGITDAAESTEFLRAANVASVGGLASVEQVTKGMIKVMSAYGDRVGNAADVSNKLFVAMRAGTTTIQEITEHIGGVVGSAAELGVGFNELMAIFATGTRVSKGTAETFDALRGVTVAIAKASIQARTEMAKLNRATGAHMTFGFKGIEEAGGLLQYLKDLKKLVDEAGDKSSWTQLFGRAEAINLIMFITGQGMETVIDLLEQMDNTSTEASDAMLKMMVTPQKQMDITKSKIDDLKISIGMGMLPEIVNAAQAFGLLADEGTGVSGTMEALARSFRLFTEFAVVVVGWAKATARTLLGIGLAAIAAGKAVTALTNPSGMAEAGKELLDAFKWIQEGSQDAFAEMLRNQEKVRNGFDATAEAIKQVDEALKAANDTGRRDEFGFIPLPQELLTFWTELEEKIKPAAQKAQEAQDEMMDNITALREAFKDAGMDDAIGKKLYDDAVAYWEAQKKGAKDTVPLLEEIAKIRESLLTSQEREQASYEETKAKIDEYRVSLEAQNKSTQDAIGLQKKLDDQRAAAANAPMLQAVGNIRTNLATEQERAAEAYKESAGWLAQYILYQQQNNQSTAEAINLLTRLNDARAREVEEFNARMTPAEEVLANLQAENEAMRMTNVELETRNALIAAGTSASPAQVEAIKAQIVANAELRTSIEANNRAANMMADAYSNAFADWISGTKSFSQAFSDMARSILADIARMIVKQMIMNALMGSSGGGSTGGFSGFMNAAFAGRAGGGNMSANQPYWTGEKGPEVVIPKMASKVISNRDVGNVLQFRGGSSNVTVNLPAQQSRRTAQQTAVEVARVQGRASSRNR